MTVANSLRDYSFYIPLTSLKKVNDFLCCFLFLLICQEGIGNSLIGQTVFEQIKSVESFEERGIVWLSVAYKISATAPKDLKVRFKEIKPLFLGNFPLKKSIFLLTEAEIEYIAGNYDQSKDKALQVIQLLTNKSNQDRIDQQLLCFSYITILKNALFLKTKKEGFVAGFKALDIAQRIDFPVGKFWVHNHIGILNGKTTNDYPFSLQHYLKAEALLPQTPDYLRPYFTLSILNNITLNYSKSGQQEKSIQYGLKLLEQLQISEYPNVAIAANNNLGANYFKLKKLNLAEKHLLKAIALMQQHQMELNLGIPLVKVGLIKIEKGKIAEAKAYVNEIELWLKKYKFIGKYEKFFCELNSKLAKANKDYQASNFWLEKAAIIQDSFDKVANSIPITDLQTQHELNNIKQEIQLLKKEKNDYEKVVYTQKTRFISGIIILILLVISFLFYQKRRFKETAQIAQKKQKEEKKAEVSKVKVVANKTINLALKDKILRALTEKKLFLDPDLTLKKFSDAIESNTSYVSKTINLSFNKNFNTLINEYRIKAFLSYIHHNENEIYTIEALFLKAGFKSKSSFQNAFKKFVGMSASQYIKELRKKN